jgi:hypothetical protein
MLDVIGRWSASCSSMATKLSATSPDVGRSDGLAPDDARTRAFPFVKMHGPAICRPQVIHDLSRAGAQRPQPGDERRISANICRKIASSAIRNVAPAEDDLGADLDQLFAQAGQRPRLCRRTRFFTASVEPLRSVARAGNVRNRRTAARRQAETLLERPVFGVKRPSSNARRIRGSRGRDVPIQRRR